MVNVDSMEEDEDRILLSSLGVTSANPDDIERDVLAAVLIWFHCSFIFLVNELLV